MSNSTSPRIVRGKAPKRTFTENTYRKAKPFLMVDFKERCAYSQQHARRSSGIRSMEVDHFNPTLTGRARHNYSNLFLSTRHCNGSKSNKWPAKAARKEGVRFLNPCREQDYGVHVFEDRITHALIGVTPAGIYHIRMCDLNAPHLVEERGMRAEIHRLLETSPLTVTGNFYSIPAAAIELLRNQFEKMIPPIPYHDAGSGP